MSAHALSPPDSRAAAGAAARSVLARRMAFVTGKGGVGKTTVSAALALAEWMARTVARPGAALLGRSDAFRYFVAAAPGARELVGIGKAWDLTRPRGATREGRLVVVDAPSSGHAVGLLQAPRTFSRLGGPGPIGHTPREAGVHRPALGHEHGPQPHPSSAHRGLGGDHAENTVDHVVTEWGIADLRGRPLADRARALIATDHPDHRDELEGEAHEAGG